MESRSLTIKGNVIVLATTIFGMVGISVTAGDLQSAVIVVVGVFELIGIVISWVGRMRHGDITLSGKRIAELQIVDSKEPSSESVDKTADDPV